MLSDEIRNTFSSVNSECFSATNLINQFDKYQSCYPEEIWRLDIERKYIRTFTGESVDNSKPKHDVQYLRDMMQGKKKYQRRQWIRDQEIYFGTMNLMNTVVGDNNRITFRCFTPTGNNIVVAPNYTLKITPFSDMYVSVMFGNGNVSQVRAKAGVEYTIHCPLSTMDDTQVTIYGANRISALNDLSACYIAANNFSMATKLRKLVLGNTTSGYNNSRLVSLTLGDNKLLEELDIRNCGNLTGSLNLAQCSNLLKLYAEGTKITGVTFATNGKLHIAHLPNTINALVMRNLNNITDFNATLAQLETLTLEGGSLNNLQIVQNTIDRLRVLYLYGINWELAETTLLNKMSNLFFSLVTGSVYISGQIRQYEISKYADKWGDLEVTYDIDNVISQYIVTFVNADNTTLYSTYVDRGSKPIDPYTSGLISKPTMASTEQYTYEYAGWDDINSDVISNKIIKATYTSTVRKYTVTWYSRSGVSLGSVEAEYGDDVVYPNETPVDSSEEGSYVYKVFSGWNKSTGYIRCDTDVYAIWDRAELPSVGKDIKDMSPAEIYGITKLKKAEDYFSIKDYFDITLGHDFDFSNVSSQVLMQNRFFDGTEYYDTGIKLFSADSPSFTIAVDYEFVNANYTNSNNSTLVGCYDDEGAEGFRLKYSANPMMQWGNVQTRSGAYTSRNMIVLRHIHGSNKLSLYSYNMSETYVDDSVYAENLLRNRGTESECTLVFGAVKNYSSNTYDMFASGWVYWSKIWFDDIGDTNARKLSSWIHEKVRMEVSDFNTYKLSNSSGQYANVSFTANNLLSHSHRMNTTNTNVGGWNGSLMREFLNGRLYNAIPDKWKNIISRVRVPATEGDKSASIVNSNDYIYIPSYVNIANTTTEPYASEGTHISYYINNVTRMKRYGSIRYDDEQIITGLNDPSISYSNLEDGSIWYSTDRGNYYTYVSSDTLNKHTRIFLTTKDNTNIIDAYDGGKWFLSSYWWFRTPHYNNSSNFGGVYTNGSVTTNISGASGSYGICICFSV